LITPCTVHVRVIVVAPASPLRANSDVPKAKNSVARGTAFLNIITADDKSSGCQSGVDMRRSPCQKGGGFFN
jgi:hypothetical protein